MLNYNSWSVDTYNNIRYQLLLREETLNNTPETYPYVLTGNSLIGVGFALTDSGNIRAILTIKGVSDS